MHLPYAYTLKNLSARKLTTLLTALGMALVVYVFATVLMLSEGLEKTLVATGHEGNVVAIRRGAETEVQSSVERDQAAIIEGLSGIATSTEGKELISKEVVVLMVLAKRGTNKPSNVTIRGLSERGLELRPQVQLIEGRLFRPGSSEIVAGQKIARGFRGAGLGERLRFGQREWTVVGVFDAGATSFSSEIWGDAEQLMQAFRRNTYSSVLFRLTEHAAFEQVKAAI